MPFSFFPVGLKLRLFSCLVCNSAPRAITLLALAILVTPSTALRSGDERIVVRT